MFLLDTMVMSEGFKRNANQFALEWLERSNDEQTFVSVISLGEIERGIRKLERREPARVQPFRVWLERTLSRFAGRIIPIDEDIARKWGQLSHDLGNANPDLLIAATALTQDLTVVTRNVRHFEPTGVRLLDPYEA
ncbi:type II toxin-antitoxin system VapC family toxin [Aurantimonas sp. MSK8Z-1]|uniref:type II toxin-antitoxin system VapC family toxin n=1 Tax=Mangrovibrevibacter kandeliae TaxID=2968473 RepID=UPI0021186F4D|nr:type II toxin-antitoxin system VapC family toxin [Aurantimonas sp. MSK8Z-1]MCW4115929.1 type II toxin-antitoxin system VapC family toxin [Aurantimonas sp. MSK8Z-1]